MEKLRGGLRSEAEEGGLRSASVSSSFSGTSRSLRMELVLSNLDGKLDHRPEREERLRKGWRKAEEGHLLLSPKRTPSETATLERRRHR
mmetsp:Transcript_52805/g.103250  ORF Transcript_52805/g.103250 Transcript_52805/m.103250 type:complete len:89 (+) Transcript_52805:51-317(+)